MDELAAAERRAGEVRLSPAAARARGERADIDPGQGASLPARRRTARSAADTEVLTACR